MGNEESVCNEVTGTRVHRVSFVRRAAVRDPQNPTEPRRRLLWKAETGTHTNPTGGDTNMTPGLTKAHAKAAALRKADSSLSALEAFEQAMRDPEIEAEYLRERDAEPEPEHFEKSVSPPDDGFQIVQRRAAELRKAEPSLSEVKAMERAMADPAVREAYDREMARAA